MSKPIHLSLVSFVAFMTLQFSVKGQLREYVANDLDSILSVEQRPVVFFIHTDWCKICHRMMHTTFTNEQLIRMLNEEFYFVKLQAEDDQTIEFNGNSYEFKAHGTSSGVHEFALAVGEVDGKIAYPTISILSKRKEIIFKHASFMTSDELLGVLDRVKDLNP